jgi:hydrogenase maturation protease
MKVLIFGAGNLLLSDEGFGVHFIQYLESHYTFPKNVELFDAGTLGIMATHKIEEAERVYIIDTVTVQSGETPGQCFRYEKEEFMRHQLPVKLSPHQIGIQEMLMISELRGCCPSQITLFGVIPASTELGDTLTPPLQTCLENLAATLVRELTESGLAPQPINRR